MAISSHCINERRRARWRPGIEWPRARVAAKSPRATRSCPPARAGLVPRNDEPDILIKTIGHCEESVLLKGDFRDNAYHCSGRGFQRLVKAWGLRAFRRGGSDSLPCGWYGTCSACREWNRPESLCKGIARLSVFQRTQMNGIPRSSFPADSVNSLGRRLLRSFRLVGLSALVVLLAAAPWRAAGQAAFPTRTQVVDLKKGWNAVFLEVEPLKTAPAEVFSNSPVDVVAQFLRPVRISQFATDPGETLANGEGWGIWYAPGREESVLSNLFALHSHTALLVHSREDFRWQVTGQVFLKRIRWKADSFNLVGFPVNSAAAPTFAEYFQGATPHAGMPVFRLVDGKWRKVDRPGETLMRRGEAYWVYCKGASDFQGPLDVDLSFWDHLRFFDGQFHATFVLGNRSPHPVEVSLIQESGGGLPLDFVFKAVTDSSVDQLAALLPPEFTMAAMEPDARGAVTLRVHDPDDVTGGASNLLRISSDSGVEYWLAVYAEGDGGS